MSSEWTETMAAAQYALQNTTAAIYPHPTSSVIHGLSPVSTTPSPSSDVGAAHGHHGRGHTHHSARSRGYHQTSTSPHAYSHPQPHPHSHPHPPPHALTYAPHHSSHHHHNNTINNNNNYLHYNSHSPSSSRRHNPWQQQQYAHQNSSGGSNYYPFSSPPRHNTHSQSHLPLHHPSPVRPHSYPISYATDAFLLAGVSTSSTGSRSHSRSRHHPPSPPLSASAMPDPWGDREHDDWTDGGGGGSMSLSNGNGNANGSALPVVHGLPSPRAAAYSPATTKRALSKRPALPAPNPIEVWASLMDLSKGRDKVLKTVQYSLRSYLYLLSLIQAVRPLTKWFSANQKRAKLAVSGLSLTRKCLLLLNPLRPAGALLSPEPTSAREFLNHLIDLIGALSDDVFCLSKLGLVSRKKGIVADRWANRIWFLNTLTGLYTQYLRSRRSRDPTEEREDEWKTRKLLCDLVFVSYDIFNLSWFKEPVLCVSGLIAALIGTGQLYNKEYKLLAKRTA